MNLEKMTAILEKIESAQKIVLFRHKRPDGDAVGSTRGFAEILKATYPEKEIYVSNSDFSDYVAFLGDDAVELSDEFYADALGIVIDTATSDRVSNPKYSLCREIVKIDHHIETEHYGAEEWVEEHKSSSCEMIAEFYFAFRDKLKLTKEAATYIYTGMVTDSGRFRFRSVSGDTLRYAGMLLDTGVDTDLLYAHLYMKDYHTLKFQSYVYKKMKMTENGVVYIYISRKTREKFGLSFEEASASVSYMDSIKGSLIWLAFIEADNGEIRVRLRSRFVTVSEIAEKYHGGGHDCASGATVADKKEMRALIDDADKRLGEYKKTHEDWL